MENPKFQLNRLAVKITTEFSQSKGNPISGSGVIYLTSNACEYIYVLTALHCLLGERTPIKGSNTYKYNIEDITKITLVNNTSLDNPLDSTTEEIKDVRENIKMFYNFDFAIIIVPKSFTIKIKDVPRIGLHSKPRFEGKFRTAGYLSNHSIYTPFSDLTFNNEDGQGIFITSSNGLTSGVDSKISLEGYSGSGVFLLNKPILVGLITKTGDEFILGNNLHVKDLSFIVINSSLESGGLELVKYFDNANRILTDNDTTELVDTSSILIEDIHLNIWKAIQNTKKDILDDWFQDPLRFQDILKPEVFYNYLKTRDKDTNTIFKIGKSRNYFIPKEGFTSRNAIQTSIIDRVIFQAAVDLIASNLDPLLSNRVYSYRYNFTDDQNEYFYLNHIEQWKKLLYKIKEKVVDDKFLVVLDLSNYFDNIPIEKLSERINELIDSNSLANAVELKKSVALIKRMLSHWKPKGFVLTGIPQNREASSFLANIFLADIDKAMEKRNFDYFRYMDDIKIVCSTKYEARKAIMLLTIELSRLGLHINSSKTKILNIRDDSEELKKHFPEDVKILEQIESLISTRREREIQIAVMLTLKQFNQILKEEKLTNKLNLRHFTFLISRIQVFAQVSSLQAIIPFDHIIEQIIPKFKSHPWLTDIYVKFLMSIGKSFITNELVVEITSILIDPEINIYDWQAFQLWKLLAFHKIENDELKKLAFKVSVDQPSIERAPEAAGAFLYLASIGYQKYKEDLKNAFNNRSSNHDIVMRCLAISLRKMNADELDFNADEELKEMHSSLFSVEENPLYVSPLPKLKISEILRNLPDKVST